MQRALRRDERHAEVGAAAEGEQRSDSASAGPPTTSSCATGARDWTTSPASQPVAGDRAPSALARAVAGRRRDRRARRRRARRAPPRPRRRAPAPRRRPRRARRPGRARSRAGCPCARAAARASAPMRSASKSAAAVERPARRARDLLRELQVVARERARLAEQHQHEPGLLARHRDREQRREAGLRHAGGNRSSSARSPRRACASAARRRARRQLERRAPRPGARTPPTTASRRAGAASTAPRRRRRAPRPRLRRGVVGLRERQRLAEQRGDPVEAALDAGLPRALGEHLGVPQRERRERRRTSRAARVGLGERAVVPRGSRRRGRRGSPGPGHRRDERAGEAAGRRDAVPDPSCRSRPRDGPRLARPSPHPAPAELEADQRLVEPVHGGAAEHAPLVVEQVAVGRVGTEELRHLLDEPAQHRVELELARHDLRSVQERRLLREAGARFSSRSSRGVQRRRRARARRSRAGTLSPAVERRVPLARDERHASVERRSRPRSSRNAARSSGAATRTISAGSSSRADLAARSRRCAARARARPTAPRRSAGGRARARLSPATPAAARARPREGALARPSPPATSTPITTPSATIGTQAPLCAPTIVASRGLTSAEPATSYTVTGAASKTALAIPDGSFAQVDADALPERRPRSFELRVDPGRLSAAVVDEDDARESDPDSSATAGTTARAASRGYAASTRACESSVSAASSRSRAAPCSSSRTRGRPWRRGTPARAAREQHGPRREEDERGGEAGPDVAADGAALGHDEHAVHRGRERDAGEEAGERPIDRGRALPLPPQGRDELRRKHRIHRGE